MIYEAGTTGAAEIPAEIVDELPRIFDQVMAAWKNEVSVGVGATLGDSIRALKIAQGSGGNRIIMWSEDYMPELSREIGSDGEQDEEGHYFDDPHEDTDSGKTTGLQRSETWDEDSINSLMNALGEDWLDLTMRLQKDENEISDDEASAIEGPQSPASAPQGGGAQQAAGPESAMSADGVTAGAEGTAPAASAPGDGGGAAGQKKPASHEEAFHQAAANEDARQKASESPQRQDLKQEVVRSLTKIKESAPKLEALKDQAPDIYQTVLDIIETMQAMATEIVNEEQPDPEEEEEGEDGEKKDSSEDTKKSERGADGRFVSAMTKEEIAARPCKHFYGKNGDKCLKCKELKKDDEPPAADTGADPSGAGQGNATRGPKGGFVIPESKIGYKNPLELPVGTEKMAR